MFGKRRRERRRQAYAAIERYEQQLRAARFNAESWETAAVHAQKREIAANADREQALQRLADANAELRRWGLEPIPRDEPESDEHPTRYRRHSDWRTTRSADEIAELLERSSIADVPPEPVATGRGYLTFEEFGTRAEPGTFLRDALEDFGGRIADVARSPGVLTAPWPERAAALRRQRDEGLSRIRELEGQLADAQHRIGDLQGDLGVARGGLADRHADDSIDRLIVERDGLVTGIVTLTDERDALREALDLEKARSADRRDADLAVLASELGWPFDEPITVNGLCLRVRDVLEAALGQRRELEAEIAEAEARRAADVSAMAASVEDGMTTRAREAEAALAEERTLREQAERSRDRAQALNLDLQRWREKERDTLAAFVEVLADASLSGTLHDDLRAPYDRAAALIEDPES